MAKIVLNTEPTCTSECPFHDVEKTRCTLSITPSYECKAVRMIPDERGRLARAVAYDNGEKVYPIDFELCPYCTTFVKEYSFQKELDKEE